MAISTVNDAAQSISKAVLKIIEAKEERNGG